MPNFRGMRCATRSTTRSAVASGSSAPNRKKSGCSPNTGGRPALIRCALTTTPDCWACRKMVVSRTRGMVSAASTSRSTSPAPTEGSWSTSPTSSRCAPGGTALISLLARIRSSMLASSTTIRSASNGWSRSNVGSPPGRRCSSRCTVAAGCPDSSVNRFAARPVGAASTIFARFAAANVITDLTVNDLSDRTSSDCLHRTGHNRAQSRRCTLLGDAGHTCSSYALLTRAVEVESGGSRGAP